MRSLPASDKGSQFSPVIYPLKANTLRASDARSVSLI